MLNIFLSCFPPFWGLWWGTGFFSEPDLMDSARPTGWLTPRIPLSLSSWNWGYKCAAMLGCLYWCWGAKLSPHQQTHPPAPILICFYVCVSAYAVEDRGPQKPSTSFFDNISHCLVEQTKLAGQQARLLNTGVAIACYHTGHF